MARLLTLIALMPAAALAGGFESEYPDNNARVLGRGGAFVAKADDPSAIQYNPAGLAKLHGVNLLLSVNLVNVDQTFRPGADTIGRSIRRFESVEQDVPLIAAPTLAVSFDFEALPMLDFAVGIYGPSGTSNRKFPNQWTIDKIVRGVDGADVTDDARGVQSSALAPNGILHEAQMIQAFPTIAVAWAINDELRVGASLQGAFVVATIKKAIAGPAPGLVHLEVVDPFTPTGILGVQYQPYRWLEFGAMYRPSFENVATGTAKLRLFNQCPEGPCPQDQAERDQVPLGPYGLGGEVPFLAADGSPDDGVTFTFSNPDILRLGARYIHPRFDVEFDYVFQRQSVHEEFEIEFDAARAILPVAEGSVAVEPLPKVADPRKYEDTHGFRLGSDIAVLPGRLTARVGASYENGASPDTLTNLDFPGLDQYSASVGLTVHFDLVDIDVGYVWVGLEERSVEDSELGIIDITVPADQWRAAGNGDFSAQYHVIGLGTTWKL